MKTFVVVDHSCGEVNRVRAQSLVDAGMDILDNLGIEILSEEEFAKQYPNEEVE